MTKTPFSTELRDSVHPVRRTFIPGQLAGLPESARRYLAHAIAPGTNPASAVRLRMHGTIKLKGRHPFRAERAPRQACG